MAAAHFALRAGAGHAGRARLGKDVGSHRVHQPEHLLCQSPDLPLGPGAAAQVEKVLQAAGVHGHHHLGLAGVGQHEAGVLVGLLGGLGPGLLFGHSLRHEAGGVAVFQLLGKVKVALSVLVHALHKGGFCLGDGLDLRRDDVVKIVQPDIPLALDAEGCDAVPGDLGQQGAADPLDAKSEAGVLDGAGMAQVAEHRQKPGRFFLGQAVQQVGDMGIGVAELCGRSHHPFGVRRVGDQTNGHHKSHSSVILVKGAKFAMVFLTPTFSKRISTIWSPAAGLTATTVPRPKTLCSTTSPGS